MKLTEAQEQWLQALESGEYKQGIGFLRDNDDCFCCLGVACELFIPETVRQNEAIYWYGDKEKNESECRIAPESIVKKLNLNTQNGFIRFRALCDPISSLAQMNDNGKTFAEIAEFIRENPELVFDKGAEE